MVKPHPLSTPLPASTRRYARALLVTLGVCMVVLIFGIVGPGIPNGFGYDARAYWGFPREHVYEFGGTANGYTIYRYSPAFVPLMTLFTLVPWTLFSVGWTASLALTYRWLAGRQWPLLLAFPPVVYELYMGNVHFLLAAAVVVGFRYPAAWAFLFLTKVTPGVGVLWFLVRREWRSLAVALGTTAAIVGLGVLTAPDLWTAWFRSLAQTGASVGDNHIGIPLAIRLAAAAVLVTLGALCGHRWTVLVASMLALPTLWDHSLAMLAGLVALAGRRDAPLDAWVAARASLANGRRRASRGASPSFRPG